MPGMGETLTMRAGPLPVWVWAVGGTGALAWYVHHKKAAAAANQQQTNNTIGSTSGTVTVPTNSNYTGIQQWTPRQRKDRKAPSSGGQWTANPGGLPQTDNPPSDSMSAGTGPAVPDASSAGSGVAVPDTNTNNG